MSAIKPSNVRWLYYIDDIEDIEFLSDTSGAIFSYQMGPKGVILFGPKVCFHSLYLSIFCLYQCDRIGLILKGLGSKFCYKSSQNTLHVLAFYLKCVTFLIDCAVVTFWDNIWTKLGYFLFQHLVTLDRTHIKVDLYFAGIGTAPISTNTFI